MRMFIFFTYGILCLAFVVKIIWERQLMDKEELIKVLKLLPFLFMFSVLTTFLIEKLNKNEGKEKLHKTGKIECTVKKKTQDTTTNAYEEKSNVAGHKR